MKVCTDACILGALAQHSDPLRIIDIGSGTGLLSLMLAQKYACPIDAVEIHPASCGEAFTNIQNSPWNDRIHIHNQRIQDFFPDHTYDLIISNPPFFHGHKKSIVAERNLALHSDALPLSDLVKTVLRLLSPMGIFYLLLPPSESSVFSKMMKLVGAQIVYRCKIRNFPDTNIFREVTAYSFCYEGETREQELIIKINKDEYTEDFIQLLKPYYQKL
jgi:tRNA1Val (adenine37-N6)-methyltransferase